MSANFNFFVMSIFALLLQTRAGIWDTFELGFKYSDDASKCFSSKYNMLMTINSEYQVPSECATIMCHDSYVISERKLEVNKEYSSIGSCRKIICDDKGKLSVETCAVRKYDKYCALTAEDLTKPYPECCPKTTCA